MTRLSIRQLVILGIGLIVSLPLGGEESTSNSPILLEEDWKVQVLPGHHPGPYRLKVIIEPSNSWPRVDAQPVSFQVALKSPEGINRKVGWLSPSHRSLTLSIPLGDSSILLGEDREAAALRVRQGQLELRKALKTLAEASVENPPSAKALSTLEHHLSRLLPTAIEHPPSILWDYRVSLAPFVGGNFLRQDIGPRAPENPRYTWQQEVTDTEDPCAGRTPEACVWERLEAIRDRLCNTLNANGAPRFFFECIVFSLKLSSEPPRVEVECNLDEASASVAPSDDQLHRIRINGEYFLTDDCLEGTILHELTHIFDIAGGRLNASLRLARAGERLGEARRALSELIDNPRPQDPDFLSELQAATTRFQQARAAYEALAAQHPEAAIERLESECRALFAELDNWDFLGPPEATRPWIVNSIQSTIEQQFLLPSHLGVVETDETAAARCNCFRRIREWLAQNPTVETVMANEDCPHGEGSWMDLLDRVIRFYCR